MFYPTSFPCTAWYVTDSLNVRECTLEGKTGYAGVFTSNPRRFSNAGNLFATRDEAVAEAEVRLARMHETYVRAGQRWTKARETVAKLKGGAA